MNIATAGAGGCLRRPGFRSTPVTARDVSLWPLAQVAQSCIAGFDLSAEPTHRRSGPPGRAPPCRCRCVPGAGQCQVEHLVVAGGAVVQGGRMCTAYSIRLIASGEHDATIEVRYARGVAPLRAVWDGYLELCPRLVKVGGPPAAATHPCCAFRGDGACRITVRWESHERILGGSDHITLLDRVHLAARADGQRGEACRADGRVLELRRVRPPTRSTASSRRGCPDPGGRDRGAPRRRRRPGGRSGRSGRGESTRRRPRSSRGRDRRRPPRVGGRPHSQQPDGMEVTAVPSRRSSTSARRLLRPLERQRHPAATASGRVRAGRPVTGRGPGSGGRR